MTIQTININNNFHMMTFLSKLGRLKKKQLRKLPGKAVCSAVSSRVRRSFSRDNFATQGKEENIGHV